ncbi:MAG: thiol-activated cytolysin family protein [Porphyromonadaceae bacterium]|nr:thiol-activated cytolysin family protein [Porphyromonadaceae bacterium]
MKQKTKIWGATALALCMLGVAGCRERENKPIDSEKPIDKTNIVAVSSLLRSAGKLEAPEEKNIITEGEKKTEDVGKRKNIITGFEQEHQKITTPVSYDYASSSEDFAILNPWPSVLWPGCIVQGESLKGTNVPATVPIYKKRKPGRILLQLVSGAGDQDEAALYEEVKDMRESNVLQAQNRLLKRYLQSGMPASVSYNFEAVRSLEELAISAGIDINRSFGKIKASFGQTLNKQKNYMLVRLYQRFFTMSYEDPDGGFRGVFTDDITTDDLAPFTGKGNPLCYISSVSYGRVYYLLVESNKTHQELTAILNVGLSGISAGGGMNNTKELEELKIKMIQLGGDAQSGLQGAVTGNFKDVANFIIKGAKLSEDNVGAPISFTVKHLYDATTVRMGNTLKYSYDKTEFVPKQKEGRIAIMLNNISIHTSANSGWTTSNKGHALLKDLSIRLHQTQGGELVNKPIAISSKRHGIKDPIYIPVYELYHERSPQGSYFNKITIYAEVELKSSAYKFGDRTERDAQIVVLERTFSYNNGTWEPNDDGPEAYRKIQTSRTIGELTFNLSLNFDFYLDSQLIRQGATGKI